MPPPIDGRMAEGVGKMAVMEGLMNLQVLAGRWKFAFNRSINKLNPEQEVRSQPID